MTEEPEEPNLLVRLCVLAPVLLVWSAVLDLGEPIFRAVGAPINDFVAKAISIDLGSDFGPWLAFVAVWILVLPFWPRYTGWIERKVLALLARLRR
jgi:hypothetical protein